MRKSILHPFKHNSLNKLRSWVESPTKYIYIIKEMLEIHIKNIKPHILFGMNLSNVKTIIPVSSPTNKQRDTIFTKYSFKENFDICEAI